MPPSRYRLSPRSETVAQSRVESPNAETTTSTSETTPASASRYALRTGRDGSAIVALEVPTEQQQGGRTGPRFGVGERIADRLVPVAVVRGRRAGHAECGEHRLGRLALSHLVAARIARVA